VRVDSTSSIFAMPGVEPNKKTFVTPRLGLVWAFARNQSLFTQYQDSVSANNGRDPVTLKPLDAEMGRSFEGGYKFSGWRNALDVTVTGYQLTKRNRADYSLFPTIRTIGEARSRGLEVDARGNLTRRLSAIASYALTDAVVTKDPMLAGTKLTNVPRHSGSLWLRYQLQERWTTGAGMFLQGQRQGDLANSFQLPGYARFDLMASYAFDLGSWRNRLQFNVNNVGDKRYYTGSHPYVQDWIQVGQARTFAVVLRLER